MRATRCRHDILRDAYAIDAAMLIFLRDDAFRCYAAPRAIAAFCFQMLTLLMP